MVDRHLNTDPLITLLLRMEVFEEREIFDFQQVWPNFHCHTHDAIPNHAIKTYVTL